MEDAFICPQSRELEEQTRWSDLPPELLSSILSQIFLSDRCNFKLVCKSWSLANSVPQPLPSVVDSPCLMFSNWKTNSWKLFHSLYNHLYDLEFQELMDAEIRFSKHGWLLMSRDKLTLFFYNPFTKEKIELPPITCSFYCNSLMPPPFFGDCTCYFSSMCFTAPPTSPDCTVVGVFSILGVEFGVLKVEDMEWKSHVFDTDYRDFWMSTCPPLYSNGVYYCLDGNSRNIYLFDPTKQEGRQWIPYKKQVGRRKKKKKEKFKMMEKIEEHYMVEVEGDIWGVFVTKKERQVSVEKLHSSEMRWIELETLGNKCLYVSPAGSFAETSTGNGTADKIYLNKFYGKSGVLYSLKSRLYHSIEGDFANEKAYGLVEVNCGAWIKPTY